MWRQIPVVIGPYHEKLDCILLPCGNILALCPCVASGHRFIFLKELVQSMLLKKVQSMLLKKWPHLLSL